MLDSRCLCLYPIRFSRPNGPGHTQRYWERHLTDRGSSARQDSHGHRDEDELAWPEFTTAILLAPHHSGARTVQWATTPQTIVDFQPWLSDPNLSDPFPHSVLRL
jgi:hypothetical protein